MSELLDSFRVDPTLDEAPKAATRSRRRVARGVTEATVKKKVLGRLNEIGYAIPKHMTGMGVRGTPDLLGCVLGRMVVIECKTIGYELEPDQRAQLRQWQNAGALAGWVRSLAHLEEILEHLHDPAWRNTFDHPGDGRGASEPW